MASRARRVSICAALGVHEIHTSPMALSWREPLMAARGRGWARRVPERVLSSRWIAASLPPVWLRRAGEQVADEHGSSAHTVERARSRSKSSTCPVFWGGMGSRARRVQRHSQRPASAGEGLPAGATRLGCTLTFTARRCATARAAYRPFWGCSRSADTHFPPLRCRARANPTNSCPLQVFQPRRAR